MTTRTLGTPSADSVQAEECWNVDASGDQVVVAHSFRVHFHYKPAFVANKIEGGISTAQAQ